MPFSKPLTVLIIDDDDGARSSLCRILKLDGYILEEADSVAAAIARTNWDKYFAILLDRRLPDGSADDLLPQLKLLAPESSILIITGNADVESSIAALRAGVADYLLKPIEPETLRARLRALAELRVARLEIAQRDAQFEFIVDHLPGAAAYVEFTAETVRFNGIISDISGYSISELTTLDEFFTRFFAEDAAAVRQQYELKRVDWDDEPLTLTMRRKDGIQRTVEFRGYGYDGHEVWLIHDVTEKDRQETQLRIRDRAIQAAHEGVVIADATLRQTPIVFVNQAFEALSGYSSEEVIGQSCELLCGEEPNEHLRSQLKAAISGHDDFSTTIKCYRKNGESFWNELSIAPVLSDDGQPTHIVAVMADVSDRRAAQEKLLQSERLAAIGQMVTGLAHESRNALQRAQACLDMLSLDLEDQPEQLELTERMRRALSDLHRHYEEVRNYAAPINLERRSTSFDVIWKKAWNSLEALWFGRDFRLIENVDGVSLSCNVDDHRIEQVFRNILENALAACDDDAVLTISCSECEIADNESVAISFHDNGTGLDAHTAASVFQPFFTTKQKGTGLGMAISKRIIEAHGGKITIGQPSTSGAEVLVELPRS